MKKKLAFVFLGIFLLLTIGVVVYFIRFQQSTQSQAANLSTLSFSPSTGTYTAGDTIEVSVLLSAQTNQVQGADLIITYDPSILSTGEGDVSIGTFFPNPSQITTIRKVVDQTVGQITYSFYGDSLSAKGGDGILATIAFHAVGPGTSAVHFDTINTTIQAVGESPNALSPNGLQDASFTVTGSQIDTPSPTPTIDVTPTTSDTATTSSTTTTTPTQRITSAPTGDGTLRITSPVHGSSVTSSMPTFIGKATPGSTVTIVIYSDPITAVVVADSTGTWRYTPTVALSDGPHSVTVTESSSTAAPESVSADFQVGTSSIPVSGSTETTAVFVTVGVALVVAGALFGIFR